MLAVLISGSVYVTLDLTMATAADRPNFLIIMTDDLGFSDLGCYGSEIATPHLDRLARGGLRFSQFYNTAKCHSSRISLLTGQYAFQAGNTKLSRSVTSAEVLRQAGYFTAMTGKWHLDRQPTDFGFDRYFGHLSGACNYYRGDRTFRLNGEPFQVPDSGFYTTVANVDYALKFLQEARESHKPWYLYVAFNAPHAPLQPLEADYRKYEGHYDIGWDAIRQARLQRQTQQALFGQALTASQRPDHVPAWDSLDTARKKWESRRMAAIAAMIDRVDQEIGRLVQDLEQAGELDNTFFLFVSDNGACPYDRRSRGMHEEPFHPDTTWSDSTGWAWARNSPFRFYKQNQFEGGIATPGIVHWPAGLKTAAGSIVHAPVHLIDVLPTMAELAGTEVPNQWPDRELEPVSGVSLTHLLNNEPHRPRPPIHLLFSNDRGLRDGAWKLVSFRGGPWQLYHMPSDRTELNDVADRHPDLVEELQSKWYDMAERVLHAPDSARRPVLDSPVTRHPEWTDFSKPLNQPRAQDNKQASIRARIATKLKIVQGELLLECNGTDSGIALDHIELPDSSVGPYQLHFEIHSEAGGSGEVFYTTRPGMKLPRGTHLEFPVMHDGMWHAHKLPLETTERIRALRLDPCSAPGPVRLRRLRLTDNEGKTLLSWPQPG